MQLTHDRRGSGLTSNGTVVHAKVAQWNGTRATETSSESRVSTRTVGVIASMGVVMAFLDNTVVGIAYPNLLKSFPGAGISGLSWVLNAYAIVFAALLIPAGRIADLIGRRRVFVAGIGLFTFASMLCALAPTAEALIAARALQGAGAALLVPASLALVLQANPLGQALLRGGSVERDGGDRRWNRSVGRRGAGPASDWRLVFLVNVPIGLVVWRLSARNLVESRAPGGRGWPDLAGSLLLALVVGALVLAIVQFDKWGALSPGVIAAVAAAAIGAAALVRRLAAPSSAGGRSGAAPAADIRRDERPHAPRLDRLLRRRAREPAVPHARLGLLGARAGLAFTPAPFVAAASAVFAGRYAAGRDARPLLFAGSVLLVIAPLWLALRGGTEPAFLEVYLPTAIVGSIGIGLTFPVVSAAAVADAPGRQFAAATALNSGIREMGAAIGIAVCVALLGTPASGDIGPFERVWVFGAVCFLLLGVTTLLAGRIQAGSPRRRRRRPTSSAAIAPGYRCAGAANRGG